MARKKKMKGLDLLATILVLIGALNWGLVALGVNLVTLIFASIPTLITVTYAAVGVAAIWSAYKLFK